tara:strand:+ start:79 stop:465 length:387 start_codon:yes stop_codon:yes gene_type:complete
MRELEKKMLRLIRSRKSGSCGATTTVDVATDFGCAIVSLYGHQIAVIQYAEDEADWTVSMSMRGWGTVTTRSRLNALCYGLSLNCGFFQKDHVQYMTDYRGSHAIETTDIITAVTRVAGTRPAILSGE